MKSVHGGHDMTKTSAASSTILEVAKNVHGTVTISCHEMCGCGGSDVKYKHHPAMKSVHGGHDMMKTSQYCKQHHHVM